MKIPTILLAVAILASSGHGGSHSSGSHYSSGYHSSSHSSSHYSSNHHGRSYASGSSFHGYYASGSHHDSTSHGHAAAGVERDSHGRIKRSEEAKKQFMRQTGHPKRLAWSRR